MWVAGAGRNSIIDHLYWNVSLATIMTHSIVFIDDDEDDLELLGESVALTFPGFECIRFSSPVRAVTYLSSLQAAPLCIFLDFNMPLMRGDEVLQTIKTYDHLTQSTIAVLSTSIEDDLKELLLSNGADYAIIKPSTFFDLRSCVCHVIEEQLIRIGAA
jgi:DNA-binding response OmpR family regulator